LVEQIAKTSLVQNKEEVEGSILIVRQEIVINRVLNNVKEKEKENENVRGKEKEIRTMIKNRLFLENHQRVQIE
jgi:hypothetical protein